LLRSHGTAFLLDRGTSYRFIVNTTLTNGSYEALVLDFDKGSELSWVSGASPTYVNGIINEDFTGIAKLTALSVDTFELVIGDYKYTMQAQYLTTDHTTDDAYFIESFLTPLPWATSYIEYNFGYLTISLQNGCVYTTPETIKVRGIVYGQNFVSNCAVDFEYFNGIMINNDYSIYDTVWFYVI
jgi:hypothetical protein